MALVLEGKKNISQQNSKLYIYEMSHIQTTDNDIKDKKQLLFSIYVHIDKKVFEFYP